MTEFVKRFLNMLVAALVAQAHRLARLAAVRYEVAELTAAYDEAAALEVSGKPELAKLLRAQLEQTISTALTASQEPPLAALPDDGARHPFVLEPPRPADSVPSAADPPPSPEGEGTAPLRRRRGRRPKKAPAAEPLPIELSPTPPPVTSPDLP